MPDPHLGGYVPNGEGCHRVARVEPDIQLWILLNISFKSTMEGGFRTIVDLRALDRFPISYAVHRGHTPACHAWGLIRIYGP